jgi:hypothetical protein
MVNTVRVIRTLQLLTFDAVALLQDDSGSYDTRPEPIALARMFNPYTGTITGASAVLIDYVPCSCHGTPFEAGCDNCAGTGVIQVEATI